MKNTIHKFAKVTTGKPNPFTIEVIQFMDDNSFMYSNRVLQVMYGLRAVEDIEKRLTDGKTAFTVHSERGELKVQVHEFKPTMLRSDGTSTGYNEGDNTVYFVVGRPNRGWITLVKEDNMTTYLFWLDTPREDNVTINVKYDNVEGVYEEY